MPPDRIPGTINVSSSAHPQSDTISDRVTVFLCYRRVDGSWHAHWLYKHLTGRRLHRITGESLALGVYYDQVLPAVEDWSAVHLPHLQTAKALIVICTPGIANNLADDGGVDWVYEELEWWRKNRKRAPILIDATGEGERWIPGLVKRRWPRINRIALLKDEAEAAELHDNADFSDALCTRIVEGIRYSEQTVLSEDLQRLRRLTRRLFASLALVVLALVMAVFAIATAIKESSKSKAARRQAELREAMGLISQGGAFESLSRWGDAKGRYTEALALLREIGAPTYIADLALSNTYSYAPPPLLEISTFKYPITDIAAAGRDAVLVAASQQKKPSARTPEYEGALTFVDTHTGRTLRTLDGSHSAAERISVAADAQLVLAAIPAWKSTRNGGGHRSANFELWDLNTNTRLKQWSADVSMPPIALSPDGRKAATPAGLIQDVGSDTPPTSFIGQDAWVEDFAFSSDSHFLFTADQNGLIKMWDAGTATPVRSFQGSQGDAKSVVLLADNRFVAAGYEDGTVCIWDTANAQLTVKSKKHANAVTSLSSSADGTMLASGSEDGTVQLWNQRNSDVKSLTHGHPVIRPRFVDEAIVVSAIAAGLRTWNAGETVHVQTGTGHTGIVHRVSLSPDNRLAVSAGIDHSCRLWDVATAKQLAMLRQYPDMVTSACFSKNGSKVLIAAGNTVSLISVEDGSELWDIRIEEGYWGQAIFSPEENVIFVAGVSGVHARDGKSGRLLRQFESTPSRERNIGPDNNITDIVIVPRSSRLLGSTRDAVHAWDTETGKHIAAYWSVGQNIKSLAVAADGRSFASGGYDKTIRVWDFPAGSTRHVLTGHTDGIEGLAFAGTSGMLVSASDDGTIRVWDPLTGREMYGVKGHSSFVRGISTSEDGYRFASSSGDLTVRFWDFTWAATHEKLLPRVREAQEKLQSTPDNSEALGVLGQWYAFRDMNEWAVRDLSKARDAGVKISDVEFARACWRSGKLEAAADAFRRALKDAQTSADRLYLKLCLQAVAPSD